MNTLLRAIDLAVDDVIQDSGRDITRIEQEKLCYFAIQEFNLPMTYSWYIAGACARAAGDPNAAPGRTTVTSPSLGIHYDRGEDDCVRRYRDYFESETFFADYDLKEIWWTNRYNFLEDFYKEYAPGRFKDLYLASIKIQTKLNTFKQIVERDKANQTLADFGEASGIPRYSRGEESDFRLLVSDFHLELAQIDELSETVGIITRGTDVLEQVFARLTELGALTTDQQEVLGRLEPYFYFGIWGYPALYISAETATGPEKHLTTKEHVERFLKHHEKLLEETTNIRKQCHEAGLYPEPGHHSEQVGEQQVAHLQEAIREVLEGSE